MCVCETLVVLGLAGGHSSIVERGLSVRSGVWDWEQSRCTLHRSVQRIHPSTQRRQQQNGYQTLPHRCRCARLPVYERYRRPAAQGTTKSLWVSSVLLTSILYVSVTVVIQFNISTMIVYQMHYLITLVSVCLSVCVCVCLSTDRLSNDYVCNSLPIFTKFCMPLGNLVVLKAIVSETIRKYITDFRGVQNANFFQFRNCDGHVFPRIITKTWNEI